MERPELSVIIPVYNAESFLTAAVESVLSQSFGDFELLLVDDCSKDGSLALAQSLSDSDDRVRIFRMPRNGGAAAARNAGIRQARGRYVTFLDSDDVYEQDLFEKVHQALMNGPDVVLWGLEEEYFRDGVIERTVDVLCGEGYFGTEELRRKTVELEKKSLYGYLWNKAYRTELLEGREIPKQAFNEDEMFNIALFDDVKSLYILPVTGTHYRIRKAGSLTHRELPEYYGIAMRRIAALVDQQERWGIYDANTGREMAGRYVRYVASELERNCHAARGLDHAGRKDFLYSVYGSELYTKLAPVAEPENALLKILASSLRKKRIALPLAIGRMIYIVKTRLPGLFYRVKG